jgi:AraC family transcriptional regulator
MRFMVIVKASKDSEAGVMPGTELLAEIGKFNEELIKAGVMLAGDGLHPSSKGARVRFSGNKRTVIDGPFAETKELIAGYWMWQVNSKQEAIEWLKRCPNPHHDDCEVEIRQVFEAADFGAEFTPEMREQEAGQRAEVLGLNRPRFEEGRVLHIAGLSETYTLENRSDIPKQWQRFMPHFGKIAGQVDGNAYGVVWNDKIGFNFDYLTGVEVRAGSALPEGFTTLDIQPQRYAVFTHTGHISNIANTIDTIWSKWVPTCGLQAVRAPCFERYTPEFDPVKGVGGTEIWVPVQV